MYITKFQVKNYKSYSNSDQIEFGPGFNVITGQNSAGKTALLEALTLQFLASPHRSLITIPVPGAVNDQASSARITFAITRDELRQLTNPGDYYIAIPKEDFYVPGRGLYRNVGEVAFVNWFWGLDDFRVTVRLNKLGGQETWNSLEEPTIAPYPPFGPAQSGNFNFLQVRIDGERAAVSARVTISEQHNISIFLAHRLRSKIYRFKAERFNLGRHAFGASSALLPDSANLPQVLNTLNVNPARFARLSATLAEILPQVKQVSIRPHGTEVEILVWSHDYATERADLAVPLNECGSGVGQVLAILYIVMTSDLPQVIVVDEPQSFLHPGAIRKLIDVLKQYPKHQYIFATHSPTVITASDPATLTMVRAVEGASSLEVMDSQDARHLQIYLSEIGARLSDVFGADNILWVEGQTEEECFPLILRKIARRSLMGRAIVGIRQTGDLQGRDKAKVLEMYRKISESKTLLPKAIAFVFDQECLSDKQKEDLKRSGSGLVHFLPRRMFENYLLDAEAIAAVANAIEGFRVQPVSAAEVEQLFEKKKSERDAKSATQLLYFCKGTGELPADWQVQIDAAELLTSIFNELSETRVSYEKTTHSVAIAEWLIEHRPGVVGELSEWLAALVWPNA